MLCATTRAKEAIVDGRRFMLEEMTWPEAQLALTRAKVGLVPVGSLEQHGPHLAMSADAVSAHEFSRRLAERVHPLAVVTAPITFGVSYHHLDFPGTVTLRPQTLISLCEDVALSLKRHGLQHVLFVNGHGGNRDALGVVTTTLHFEHGMKAAHVLWPLLAPPETMAGVTSKWLGHSCEMEVSMIMHLKPERVRTEALTEGQRIAPRLRHSGLLGGVSVPQSFAKLTANGAFGGAPNARPALGEAIVQGALERMAEFLEDFVAD